ncbi:MAG: amidohydrolase family protein [Chloroflexota bacterium]
MQPIHNCHTHIFTLDSIPDQFLPFGLVKLARTRSGGAILSYLLNQLWPFARNDKLDRLAAFLNIGDLRSQKEIFEFVMKYYPNDSRFVVLSLDLEHMGAGVAPLSYIDQLRQLIQLKYRYPDQLLAFVCADPRRERFIELVTNTIEKHEFSGIKLYPSLGFCPNDDRMMPLYAYAEAHQIPIIAHCSRGGIYYQGKRTPDMCCSQYTPHWWPLTDRKNFANRFVDPNNYRPVLERFPNLRICFAHYGGQEEWNSFLLEPWPNDEPPSWLSVINDFIRQFPNVYTDIAFTAFNRRFWPLIKVLMNTEPLKDRILYGSDFYMVRTAVSEREFSINLRGSIGEAEYTQMARTNPARFLKLDENG